MIARELTLLLRDVARWAITVGTAGRGRRVADGDAPRTTA